MSETLSIVVEESGARVVKRRIDAIGTSAKEAGGSAKLLRRALGLLGGAAIVREYARLSDSFTNIQNRLKTVTTSTGELEAVTQRLAAIANDTRQSFEGTAEVYSRVGRGLMELGASQQEILDFTESLNKAVALSGAGAQEANGAMIQLAQGLGAGALRGEELNSVLEGTPEVARVIAKELGVGLGQLKAFASQGKITGDVVLSAFKNAREELDERFLKSVPTIGQAFTVLRNNIIQFIGNLNQTTGIADKISRAILFMAGNIDTLGRIAITVAEILGAALFARALGKARLAVLAFNQALLANPFVIIAAAIAAVVLLVTNFADKIKLVEGNTATLRDLFSSLGSAARAALGTISGAFSLIFDDLGEVFGTIFDSFGNLLVFILTVIDKIVLAFKLMGLSIKNTFLLIVDGIIFAVAKAVQFVAQKIEDFINTIADGLAAIQELLPGQTKLFPAQSKFVDFGNFGGGLAADAKRDALQRAAEVEDAYNAFFSDELSSSFKAAADATIRFLGGIEGTTSDKIKANLDKAGDAAANSAAGKDGGDARRKLAEEIRNLEDAMNPLLAATRELFDAQTLLNSAQDAGIITEAQSVDLLNQKREALSAQLDPLGAVTDKLKEQIALLKVDQGIREQTRELQEIENQLTRAGVKLSSDQQEELRGLIQEREKLSTTEAEAIKVKEALADADKGLSSGLRLIAEEIRDVGGQIEDTLVNAFHGAEAALVSFVTTGEINFKGFVDSVLADLTRLAARMALLWAIDAFSGGGGGGAVRLGDSLMKFQHGGSFHVGGSGGPDTQLVAFRASPGERVDVTPPGRGRQDGGNGGSGGGSADPLAVRIVNVVDRREIAAALQGTEGERLIVNAIGRNPEHVRRLLSR